jgi:hypothetical protein
MFRRHGDPVISVDAKKNELIGNFKNNGKTWCLEPEEVNMYDFPSDSQGRSPRRSIQGAGSCDVDGSRCRA